ncbi:MAG: TolC family protein, partial [Verrucomicrobiota bacterium]|nr:TolC family protein [Verrucomicrobiota bacterium]
IDSLIRQAESSYERIEATRLARVSGELAVKNERTLRDEGASTDFVVLRAERDLTSRRYSEIRAKADYLIALSRLALAEGSTLENRGITVEFVEE